MLERFTEDATKVVLLAQEECRRLGHQSVCGEHILLGLIAERASSASKFLRSMGFNLKDARIEVGKLHPPGVEQDSAEGILMSDDANTVFERAWTAAKNHSQIYVDAEHLLLSLTFHQGNVARIITTLGTTPDVLRNHFHRRHEQDLSASNNIQRGDPPYGAQQPASLDGQLACIRMAKHMVILVSELIPQMMAELDSKQEPSQSVLHRLPEMQNDLQQLDAALRERVPSIRESLAALNAIAERLTKDD